MVTYGFNDRQVAIGLRNQYLRGKDDKLGTQSEPFTFRQNIPVVVENRTGETIPAYGAVFVDGSVQAVQTSDVGDFTLIYTAIKPTSDGPYMMFLAAQDIINNSLGSVQTGTVQRARYDGTAPTDFGRPFGPADGQWYLTDDNPIYFSHRFLGDQEDNQMMVSNTPVLEFVGKPDTDVAVDTSATVSIYREGADTGLKFPNVFLDWMHGDQQISAGKETLCRTFLDENLTRFVGAECEDDSTGSTSGQIIGMFQNGMLPSPSATGLNSFAFHNTSTTQNPAWELVRLESNNGVRRWFKQGLTL